MGCGELTSPPSWGGHEVTTHSTWNAEGTRVYHTPQVCTHRHTPRHAHTDMHTHRHMHTCARTPHTAGWRGTHAHAWAHRLAQTWAHAPPAGRTEVARGGGSAVPGPAALVPGGEQVREDSGRGEEG